MQPNVLFLTSDNEISGIMDSLFRGRQNIFIIFSTNFVVKCATKIVKIGCQIKSYIQKYF